MARDLALAARRKLAMIDAAERLDDLRSPPGHRPEVLRGNRAGQHSIRINDQFARHFGISAGFWLNLQKSYELEVAERAEGERIRIEVAPRVAA